MNTSHDEWVEIRQPSSKEKIYANLKYGLCAKQPPQGSTIRRVEDYSEHWWELLDQKTGKLYYYNPEQQRTVWKKPEQAYDTSNQHTSRKILIIPASKLQTFKKIRESQAVKIDVSTQTYFNTESKGTQTAGELESSLNPLITSRNFHISNDIKSKINCLSESFNRASLTSNSNYLNRDNGSKQMSTFKTISPPKDNNQNYDNEHISMLDSNKNNFRVPSSKNKVDNLRVMESNNLSHYLIREAQAMGVALISDDEFDDDEELNSEDDYAGEDEESDFRDDSSGQIDCRNDLSASQKVSSRESWKYVSDNGIVDGETSFKRIDNLDNTSCMQQSSPSSSDLQSVPIEQPLSLSYLMDRDEQPEKELIQQLNHQKLVDNFRKLRHNSSFNHSSKSAKTDQFLKSEKMSQPGPSSNLPEIPYKYQQRSNYGNTSNERHLQEVTTLSTLPRQYKGLIPKPTNNGDNNRQPIDADYDVVEENCGYYSDSENFKELIPQRTSNIGAIDKSLSINESQILREKMLSSSTFSVESFAKENLVRHPRKSRLLFSRKVKWSRMIKWTENSIKQPMIASVSAEYFSDAVSSFKLIQQFMGDRKITMTKKLRQALAQSEENILKQHTAKAPLSKMHLNSSFSSITSINIPDKLRDEIAFELVIKGCLKAPIRDEIFVQLARQLTENPNQQSVEWGLILMSLLLSYFCPTSKFVPFFLSFLENQTHQMATEVCLARLTKRLRISSPYCRSPLDAREISMVRLSITKWPQYCGIFGESLERTMQLQSCSPYLSTLNLPWILIALTDKLLNLGANQTEGIFRCTADYDFIAQLRLEIDCVDFRKIINPEQIQSLLINVHDPHVVAGLLKAYFRQLPDPVFPVFLYNKCLNDGSNQEAAIKILMEDVPELNRNVVVHLLKLLQNLNSPDAVAQTKMDESNLAMVWAPNLLRSPESLKEMFGSGLSLANGINASTSSETNSQCNQSRIFEQTRQEMQFIKTLITNLDTNFTDRA